ncbi:MAG: Gfo/Idh/MocA family protein [Pirellulaceae bacterium]
MSHPLPTATRRDFLKHSGTVAYASVLAATFAPHVHAAEDNEIQVALIGCGGRGTGAAANALAVKRGPLKLVAMADVFEDKLNGSYNGLQAQFADRTEVPEDRRFLGFDGYRKAMDCLKPGDVAILATPPAFRWVQFAYAIEKGLHVFMEKPVTVDGPTTRKMFQLAEDADKKNLKVGVGLMVRHCRGRRELYDRIRSGEIGDIIAMRAYRMSGRSAAAGPNKSDMSDVLYQIRNFHSFLWASGGVFSDYYIHQIDECSWMKDAWPVDARACGGRHYREGAVDQNLDNYSVEYTYPDGAKLFYYGRNMTGCQDAFASFAHGSRGGAIISTASHTPGRVRTFKNQSFEEQNQIWAFPQPEPNPYQMEWEDLVDAIRDDTAYNEVKRGATASLVTSMGRMAAHTGQIITFDQMLNCEHEFAPEIAQMSVDGPAPIKANDQGEYPVPMPGILTDREYEYRT